MLSIQEISCRQAVALISDYLDGGLKRRARRRLEKHLANCDACSGYLDQMRTTITLAGSVSVNDLSEEALDDLVEVYFRFIDEQK